MYRVHGYMVGYIRAFDRHFNLVLTDVDEVVHYQVNSHTLHYTTYYASVNYHSNLLTSVYIYVYLLCM